MFSMRSYTRVVTFEKIRQTTWPPCDFENFFSRTAEGIELKYGIYVPMNVFNMCSKWPSAEVKFALKPYGKQHFHLLLENS